MTVDAAFRSFWASPDVSPVVDVVRDVSSRCLNAYREQPTRVIEDFSREAADAFGAYRERQLFELVQNGADAMIDANIQGRIEVILTETHLYCANEGAPIDEAGARALMHSHMSRKRADQIGHFGLGFKSVLAVSRSPQLYSRSGSFAFDADWAASQIRRVAPEAEQTPVLRVARPADANAAAMHDPELASLMQWATTVVVLPLIPESYAQIERAIQEFPAPFLLFAPVVREIWLSSRVTGKARFLRAAPDNDGATKLIDDQVSSRWRLFERTVQVSREAIAELLPSSIPEELRRRVPIAWAVAIDDSRATGRFWSFFPTNDESTLSGILNAGWKTNNDRHALLSGPLNRELLGAFAELVAEVLPELVDATDCGRHLDLLPARDPRSTADEELFRFLVPVLKQREIVPDVTGRLRIASALWLHPKDLPHDAVSLWATATDVSERWVHPAVDTRERRPRVARLGSTDGLMEHWLREPVRTPTIHNARVAVRVLGMLHNETRYQYYCRHARILLTSTGDLVEPDPEKIFLTAHESIRAGCHLVHPEVVADPQVRQVLVSLGLRDYNEHRRLETLAIELKWLEFWETAHAMGDEASEIVRSLAQAGSLCVRTEGESFEPFFRVLLRGPIVPGPDDGDRRACIDERFHYSDLPLLKDEGLVSVPAFGGARAAETALSEFRAYLAATFLDHIGQRIGRQSKPQQGYLVVTQAPVSGPLDPLLSLSPPGAARYTETLLRCGRADEPWKITHKTRPEHYGAVSDVPVFHALRTRGRLETSLGIVPVTKAFGAELASWAEFIPVSEFWASGVPQLMLPTELDELSDDEWQNVLERAETAETLKVGDLYFEAASRDLPPPRAIRCVVAGRWTLSPPSAVCVSDDPTALDAAELGGAAVLRVTEARLASLLIDKWRLKPPDRSRRAGFEFVPSALRMPATERFFHSVASADLEVVACSDLWVEVATEEGLLRESRPFYMSGGILYFRDSLPDEEVIAEIRRLLPGLPVIPQPPRDESLLERLRSCTSNADRLATLFGEARLRRRLPVQLLDQVRTSDDPLDAHQLAAIALSIHGAAVLRHFTDDLAALGLDPPARWNGSERALEFVARLGFGAEYAGTPAAVVAPWIEIPGPIAMRPLHPFQSVVESNIRKMLQSAAPGRGFVSLPTGAGKTRVVAQALTGAYVDRDISGYLLWIADREELCEQAVQTWSEVWRAFGPPETLRISRLWGATNRRIQSLPDQPHLVVATYQSLNQRLSEEFSWLSEPACIVVDEAHGSTAPSFTRILEWLGLDFRTTPRPLIGISATPFKGDDAEETGRLVKRYGQHRFDHGAFPDADPYPFLQQTGVLAQVDHRELPGVRLEFTPAQMEHVGRFHELPSSLEEQLGTERARNETIVNAIEGLPRDWPVLAFSLSVTHAELLAALLSLRGTPAVAISSRTPPDARRAAITAFRRGDLRILTNFNVLTTGFDAPGIRAIVVARPVFSPGLYQQMIGRGLRGPANGGKERCLIMNVSDNLSQFGENLAFRHFEHLWSLPELR